MTFAHRIKAARLTKGWWHKDCAKALGCCVSTISGWESGRNMPSVNFIRKIAEVYGIPLDELIVLIMEGK